jgi:hypothetical protein
MLRNTCGAKPRSEAARVLPLARDWPATRPLLPMGLLLAGILAGVMAIAGPVAAARGIESQVRRGPSTYQLAAQLPGRIRKGEPASLVLHVQKNGRPIDNVAACLVPAPLFTSEEDALDATPALGADLGAGAEPGSQAACVGAIAAVRIAPGVYKFTWEPDTPGRVNLRFTVGDSQLNGAVNVSSAPPNAAILIAFVLLVAAILGAAGRMRRTQPRQGSLM